MKVADLEGLALDYWVARSLHDFVREIQFTDSGETVAIRGNDRGRPWDGRFTPCASWDAAAAVLERARRLEVLDRSEDSPAHLVAEFEGGRGAVEGRADSLRVALLRAFVESRFGDSVDEMLHEPQMLTGAKARRIGEASADDAYEDLPSPDGHIGDIQSPPRQ
ncbi:phage protein NinX family protein [Paraburkholderia sp. MPAMCS5]|uniref:phage protein NinX family protein n=1 Tax=Paraburkholderia sp. MPAMCS5 TaxID=3112563 RepID=UPI002E1727AE|nr:phage protein NinX family protein [Paraburkholderia sp. MPAMCS5]